ncbi:Pr6Pr family membrane protein [Nocardia sp. NPDC048505]|uniref:Pr6Pr family membrane protein n=1 Tax=unclassified Nocardia TaxID=2637762 RepID=UPI0033F7FA1E
MHAVAVSPSSVRSPSWLRASRVAFAVLGLLALIAGPVQQSGTPGYTVAAYLSSFTVQSNILAVAILFLGGLRDPSGRRWQLWRGAATLYLVITGIVYAVLLSNVALGPEDPWISAVLHRVLPIVLVVDWVAAPYVLGVSARLVATWLAYPAVYAAYTLFRGLIVNWYPYPFLDPRGQGYVSMTVGLVVLGVAFALLAVAVLALSELTGRWCGAAESEKQRWLE